MRRWFSALLALILLVGAMQPVGASPQQGCAGLTSFALAVVSVGQRWERDTQLAGVGYTADPTQFDATDWTNFAELAREKQHHLDAIAPLDWTAAWLDVQVDAAGLQADAGDAAVEGGLVAIGKFGPDFIALMQRETAAAEQATERCPAFADVAALWKSLDRDFDPAQS